MIVSGNPIESYAAGRAFQTRSSGKEKVVVCGASLAVIRVALPPPRTGVDVGWTPPGFGLLGAHAARPIRERTARRRIWFTERVSVSRDASTHQRTCTLAGRIAVRGFISTTRF